MRRFLPLFLFAVAVVGYLLTREARVQPLAGVENTFVNWLAANTAGQHGSAPLMLVEINDNCLLDYPWPWTPLNYAAFLDGSQEFNARVAAIEPVLAWDPKNLPAAQATQEPQYEKLLHNRILKTPKLELGAQLGQPEDPDILPPQQPLPILRDVTGPTEAVPEYTVIESEPGEDIRLTTALGFTNMPRAEHMMEHAPLVFRYRGQVVPSFALQAMMLWYGVVPEEVQVRLGDVIRLGDKLTIPVNDAGAIMVDWKVEYDRAGFDDFTLAVDQFEQKHTPVIAPEKLKDRLLILARTDAASQTIALPTGRMGSAGEVFAATIATAETGAFARQAGYVGTITIIVLGILLAWLLAMRGKGMVFLIIPGFITVYLLVCLGVFEGMRMALPVTPMLGVAVFAGVSRLLLPKA